MTLLEQYWAVDGILEGLDFVQLAAGFHRYPFALYDGEWVCLDGTLRPWTEAFRGNTALLLEGEYVAIWNLAMDPVEDPALLAASLVHEMYHCHQLACGEGRFPSDLALLRLPDELAYFSRRQNEVLCLLGCCETGDVEELRRFAALRARRLRDWPELVLQELRTETIEGMAEFVGLKALRSMHSGKFDAAVRRHMELLGAEGPGCFHLRRQAYSTGALYFLCLERLGRGVCNAFDSPLTTWEQNPVDTRDVPVTVQEFPWMEGAHAALCAERRARIDAVCTGRPFVPCAGEICGYDPMNMFRLGDRIWCGHFVCLLVQGETRLYHGPLVLELQEGTDGTVKGYYQG